MIGLNAVAGLLAHASLSEPDWTVALAFCIPAVFAAY